ncbi:FAD-binding protein [Vibrio sp. 10N.261.46.E12]|uniref:FAD-binding oxidoreductase n=1 Tax=unclassified Vibrio TaxID=2614977 RepID=UPI0009767C26|nr:MULTISPECIES: FAD-binding oxidoreductase [unclassified Vibrio]OMO32555.1 FAD-linked oxidase [Vibrio sp. 10N.261.45.E1]PMJ26033.1 FAD-linked oxidase [Vibrio sp. 10N.286.45.B6]PML89654.1 FAD-linked oxidase [Vibrio sp. 10N.261.49.E11]PMM69678.1 FAD-linked oxidase [Vibrio sp. 10N.261.46.F12]PMM90724.1 FAD-linked oxidase [Vibrio sp. 10N.261.46.E8]
MKKITSWGKYPLIDANINVPSRSQKLANETQSGIARGLGRSYGDSALSENIVVSEQLNHFISFDENTGTLRCEAGVSLDEILTSFVPKGWFLSVTPGTKFVTVGGAIASDVHGKNHHLEGSFSDHVTSLTLITNEQEITCSREDNPDLFHATCGGMGLTGIITEATFKLKPITSAYINQKVVKAKNLEIALALFEQYKDVTYSVAWIDCLSTGDNLGRSLLMLGEHADKGELTTHKGGLLNMPCDMPSFLLNKYTIQTFNSAYYNKQLKEEVNNTVHYDPFFYPLDGINNWNRMYGSNGFTQYQFVIPKEAGKEGLTEILEAIAESKQGSFLAVLKVFGEGNKNLLSFPMEGYTLALDFKLNEKLFTLLDRLDIIVRKYEGRLYLSKDVRMPEEMFKAGYPQWEEFQALRKEYGVDELYHSFQSKRIGL